MLQQGSCLGNSHALDLAAKAVLVTELRHGCCQSALSDLTLQAGIEMARKLELAADAEAAASKKPQVFARAAAARDKLALRKVWAPLKAHARD